MVELIAAGVMGVYGHLKSRAFVGRRLRYTNIVETPALGLWVGAAATVIAAPIVAVLPFVGAGTAIVIGAGVGTGVALGVKDTKEPPKLLED